MSNLTKEECLNYKNELQFAYDHVGTRLDNVSLKDAISLGMVGYEKLINEHFDNPHLELEELKVGMHCYVFVNTEVPTFNMKVDALITKICDDKRIEFIFVVENGMVVYKRIPFKENRFYAKEVKDDE